MRSKLPRRHPRSLLAPVYRLGAAALAVLALPAQAIAVLALPAPALAAGVVIERILAVVDGRPVMWSEVQVTARLLGAEGENALEKLIDERLMLREASRLPQTAVTAQDEQLAYESLVERAPALARGPAEADLRRVARRQTAILKYIDFRFRPQVRVADEDVRKAYTEEFGGRPDAPAFEARAAEIRKRLEGKELDKRIEAWVRELRAGAEIRYNP